MVADLPDATLAGTWHPGFPDSLVVNIARNTYRHYAEQLPAVRRLRAGLEAG